MPRIAAYALLWYTHPTPYYGLIKCTTQNLKDVFNYSRVVVNLALIYKIYVYVIFMLYLGDGGGDAQNYSGYAHEMHQLKNIILIQTQGRVHVI